MLRSFSIALLGTPTRGMPIRHSVSRLMEGARLKQFHIDAPAFIAGALRVPFCGVVRHEYLLRYSERAAALNATTVFEERGAY